MCARIAANTPRNVGKDALASSTSPAIANKNAMSSLLAVMLHNNNTNQWCSTGLCCRNYFFFLKKKNRPGLRGKRLQLCAIVVCALSVAPLTVLVAMNKEIVNGLQTFNALTNSCDGRDKFFKLAQNSSRCVDEAAFFGCCFEPKATPFPRPLLPTWSFVGACTALPRVGRFGAADLRAAGWCILF